MSQSSIRLRDRREAGRLLASKVHEYGDTENLMVLAMPRGGVPVAYEIATALEAPLDLFLVRMLGVPGYDEVAMGAVTTGGATVLNSDVINYLKIPTSTVDLVAERERMEMEKRRIGYCGGRASLKVEGRTIILVDDGLTTVSTVRYAVQALKQLGPARIVLAVPIASQSLWDTVCKDVDHCISLQTSDQFGAGAAWYQDFIQPPDSEIRDLIDRASVRAGRLERCNVQ